jgi:adenosylcobinamide-GDP ribazoletransferase
MSDHFQDDGAQSKGFRPFAELLNSLRFLTRLPIPFARTIDPPAMTQSIRFFGLAGGMIGAINGLILVGLIYTQIPAMLAAVFTCAAGVLMTGGLHEDGLADSADGLYGGKTRDDRLLIMRDSRIGSYGALALGLAILARVATYEALATRSHFEVIMILAAVGAFSRAMMVDMMWATRPARQDGLSVLVGRPSRNTALFAIVTGGALVIYAGSLSHIENGFVALILAMVMTGLMRRVATRLIGGQTGDICGAVQVLCEIVMLAASTAMIG